MYDDTYERQRRMPTNLWYSCRFRLGRGALPWIRVILLIRLNANQMLEHRISRTDCRWRTENSMDA
jgi:hypothetical protein